MPRKITDQAILAEIREVMADMQTHLRIKNKAMGGSDILEPELALEIIGNLVNRTEDSLTRDYRTTKAARLGAVSSSLG